MPSHENRRLLFYQLGIMQFGSLSKWVLEMPRDIGAWLSQALRDLGHSEDDPDLLRLVNVSADVRGNGVDSPLTGQNAHTKLYGRREMLGEEFSIDIDDGARLIAVPAIVPAWTPPRIDCPRCCMGWPMKYVIAHQFRQSADLS